MIGSPALRGAAASLGGGAGRACPATASAVSAVSAAIAASVNTTGGPQRRVAAVDCAVENRLNMLCPLKRPCSRLRTSSVRSRLFLDLTADNTPPIRFWGLSADSMAILSYMTARVGGRLARGWNWHFCDLARRPVYVRL